MSEIERKIEIYLGYNNAMSCKKAYEFRARIFTSFEGDASQHCLLSIPLVVDLAIWLQLGHILGTEGKSFRTRIRHP